MSAPEILYDDNQIARLAELAYVAYAEHQNWTNHQGQPIPPWDMQREDIQRAWHSAARRLARALLDSPEPRETP